MQINKRCSLLSNIPLVRCRLWITNFALPTKVPLSMLLFCSRFPSKCSLCLFYISKGKYFPEPSLVMQSELAEIKRVNWRELVCRSYSCCPELEGIGRQDHLATGSRDTLPHRPDGQSGAAGAGGKLASEKYDVDGPAVFADVDDDR